MIENKSGLVPCEYKVLVQREKVEEITPGKIYIPDQIREKERRESVHVTLIAVGGNAFEDWAGEKPKPGDKVLVAKYAGYSLKGSDGEWYTIMHDKDIAAIVAKEQPKEYTGTDQPDNAGDGKYAHLRSV